MIIIIWAGADPVPFVPIIAFLVFCSIYRLIKKA
jgi:hypothetical protein